MKQPNIRLAAHPADHAHLDEDTSAPPEPMELPTVGDRLMLRRMVDRHTRQPVPVRVAQVLDWTHQTPPVWVVVLTREQ